MAYLSLFTVPAPCPHFQTDRNDRFITQRWPTHGLVCLVIPALQDTILLHCLSCNHTVRVWNGVKLCLIAPSLCLLGTSHAEAAGMLLGLEAVQELSGKEADSRAVEGSVVGRSPVFPPSNTVVVYCSAVAAWSSSGLICHPVKTGQHRCAQSASELVMFLPGRQR